MKTYAIGDIHGCLKAVEQCLERSNFDKENDELILLGDIVDGWRFVKETIDLLLTIKNRYLVIGNHDEWFMNWYDGDHPGNIWTSQGGRATQQSYDYLYDSVPESHKEFFKQGNYIIQDDERNHIYTHGGFRENINPLQEDPNVLMWDRSLVEYAYKGRKISAPYDKIFVGHTTVQWWVKDYKPLITEKVIGLDTGAGWSGKLTIMNVDTLEYFQSDLVTDLYPNEKGRD